MIVLVLVIFVLGVSTSGCSSFSLNPFDWGGGDEKNPSPSKGRPTIQQFSPNPSKRAG